MRELVSANERRPLWGALNDFDNLFEGFLSPRRVGVDVDSGGALVPAIDVSENENEYRIKAEIPGVKKEDLNVSVHDGILTINAESRYEDEEKKEGRVIRQERRYGKYVRSVRLSKDVNSSGVRAEYKDGVLDIVLPKTEEVKPKKIDIAVT